MEMLKEKIEKALSEILSDKYECKVVLHFERKEEKQHERNCISY